ncbi:MAG: SH3 domain-containing protein [Acidaminococcaceae bacterium]|nr:SH3 domain-containing protein [Acidaminococcaceae bacterium]
MKRTRTLLTMLLLTMLLLISVTVRAALPQDGVYEKRDADGKVTAKMYVLTLSGKGLAGPGQRTLESSGGAPYIALEALDGNGNVTEALATAYSWKTDTAGAGETGIRLTGDNLRNSLERYKKFTPEKFSTSFGEQCEFSFLDEGEAHAYHCSPALDGTYVRYGDAEGGYPLAMFLYAYERAYNMNSFYRKDVPSNTYVGDEYSETPYFGDYHYLHVSNPNQQVPWAVMAEKGFRIVMEDRHPDYHFLFVKDDYNGDPSWVGITWGAFTGTAMTNTNALYLHRHLTLHAPEVLEDPAAYIRLTDFYSGEGPEAVTTNAMAVLLNKNGELLQLAKADISDRGGEIRFRKMMGRASIKGEGVRIRQQPNTNCAILGEKDNGYPLTVLGFVQESGQEYSAHTWAKVRLDDGTVGYVSGQFIQGIDTPFNY